MGKEPAPMIADFARQIELGHVSVAYNESSFSGYVVFYKKENHLHLENVAVLPSQSGKGIGKRLIKHVELTALNHNIKAVELYTNEAMTENLSMYPKLGYIEFERKFEDGFYRAFFRKDIK
nr:GNAT family N-acetyltransferase [Cocleimonas flava]